MNWQTIPGFKQLYNSADRLDPANIWVSENGKWIIVQQDESWYRLLPRTAEASYVFRLEHTDVVEGLEDLLDIVKRLELIEVADHIEPDNASEDDRGVLYKLPNDGAVYIDKRDLSFIGKLRKLPTETIINIMQLNVEEMEKVIKIIKQSKYNQLVAIFKKDWRDKECGEPVLFNDPVQNSYNLGIEKTDKQILTMMKSGKLTAEQINNIFSFFESFDNVYDYAEREDNS